MIKAKEKKGGSYKFNNLIKPRRKIKNETMIYTIEDAIRNPDFKSTYDKIFELVKFSPEDSYKKERQQTYFEKNSAKVNKNKKPNQIEKMTGVDFTPTIQNQVRFHDVKFQFLEGVKEELRCRGFDDLSSCNKITECKTKLKELVMEETQAKCVKEVKFFPILSSMNNLNQSFLKLE